MHVHTCQEANPIFLPALDKLHQHTLQTLIIYASHHAHFPTKKENETMPEMRSAVRGCNKNLLESLLCL